MGYLRREIAIACPVHQAVLAKCADDLELSGRFKKDDVVKTLGFQAMESAIRWDYIVEFLREQQSVEVVPMAEAFWKQHKKSDRAIKPEKFMASGHGKKTVGYASVEMDGGVFALKKLKYKRTMANGTGEAFKTYAEKLRLRNIGIEEGSLAGALLTRENVPEIPKL